MASKKKVYYYLALRDICVPYVGPIGKRLWEPGQRPPVQQHSLQLRGPYDPDTGEPRTIDLRQNGRLVRAQAPGDVIATREPIGEHLTTEYVKAVSRPTWLGLGSLTRSRAVLEKLVPPKLKLLKDDEITPEVQARARFPFGEKIPGGRPFGDRECDVEPVWHESLFVDQRPAEGEVVGPDPADLVSPSFPNTPAAAS
jgi:hypothetical protein